MNFRRCAVLFALASCHCSSGSGSEPSAQETWLDAPGEMPATLEETGLYPDLHDLGRHNPRAVLYEPAYPLWTNGSIKQRFVVLPGDARIDTSDSKAWEFPEQTLFFKTFSYEDQSADDGLRPIETRVIRRTEDAWEFYVYLWAKDRDSAELLDGVHTTPVEVEYDGEEFEHVVPARLDCRTCHESQPVGVIGFDELQLNSPLEEQDDTTQLEELARRGVLSELPDHPDEIAEDDATTRKVLGYLQGNCAHCHNGWNGPSSAFDMRHDVALENLIGVETTSELLTGVRVVPGSAKDSALYKALTRDPEIPNTTAMPPIGVDLVDRAAVEMVGDWIDGLEDANDDHDD